MFGLLLMLLSGILAAAGCSQKQTLKVGMESDFRPFTYTEEGENKGFEVELWKAIAQKAGYQYELVPIESRETTAALNAGKIDLVIAGTTVNKARKDELAFSDPYFQTGLVMLTSAKNTAIKSKDDLKGKTVGTKLGSTAYTYAGSLPKLKEVKGYPTIKEAYHDLIENKVDCVIFDERNVHDFIQNDGNGKVKIVGDVLTKESYAISAKKRSKHIGPINSAIEAVVKDGTYESLYVKWFGGKPQKLPGQ